MKIAIQGAGVAGPSLAYWLLRLGHEPFLVERAPRLRGGGYVVDFWGLGYELAERMGILPRVLEAGYQVKELRFVDARGRVRGRIPFEVFGRLAGGRFTSLRRSELAAAVYDALAGQVETLFDETITAIEEHPEGVRVAFERAPPREVDLVVGADGLHSGVRALAFGPEERFERFLGYRVAAAELGGYRPRDERVYVAHGIPGAQVSRFTMRGDSTLVLFVFATEEARAPLPDSDAARRAELRRVFAGAGWETPAILDALDGVEGIYFDRVSQIRMPTWSKGRVVLLGDAAACVSLLAGEGTGLALIEAAVLADELAAPLAEPATAFASYERRLRPFLAKKQASAAKFASSFAPKTRLGLWFRDAVTRVLALRGVAELALGRGLRDDFELPEIAREG